jgi:hypothetical protein
MKNVRVSSLRAPWLCHWGKIATVLSLGLMVFAAQADTVLVNSKTNTPGDAITGWPPYQESLASEFFSSSGSPCQTEDPLPAYGSRFGVANYPWVKIKPTLQGTGHVYRVDVTHPISSTIVADTATDISVVGGTPSTNKTLAMGQLTNCVWTTVCYITNDPGVYEPELTLTYSATLMDGVTPQPAAGFGRRWWPTPLRFVDVTDPCLSTPALPAVHGPLVAGQTYVDVPGVASNATAVTVYADGAQIGTKASGVTAGVNRVTTSALVKDKKIVATQTISGQEGCAPTAATSGPVVGSGPNSSIRVSLTMSQDATYGGPIGAYGAPTPNLYWIAATGLSGGYATAPAGGRVITPSTNWQTLSFTNGVDPEFAFFGSPIINPDPNAYAAVESIAFCVEVTTNTGPFNVYIDNLLNGTNVIQDFESATNGEPQVQFLGPATAVIPGGVLAAPNVSQVTTEVAETGSKSLKVNWQFTDSLNTMWLRLLASGSNTPNPQVDLSQPISFGLLLPPPGWTPVTPPPGRIEVEWISPNVILSWTGTYVLQSSLNVTGTYTDVGGATSPYTNAATGTSKFFRTRTP